MRNRRRSADLDIVAAIAAAQQGLVTSAQLVAAGVSRSTTQHRIRTGGPWTRVLRGVYLVTGGRPDRTQMRHAALLHAGDDAVLTGRDALDLHGVERRPVALDAPVHVLVPESRRPASTGFVLVERTRRPARPLELDGLRVAPVPRALVDASRRLARRSDVVALLARGVQAGFCEVGELQHELRTAHRRSTALVRDAMEHLRAGVRSAPEARLRELWLASGLPEPLWNVDLTDLDGTFLARPDAYLVGAGVVVEVDSVEFHLAPADWTRTMLRHSRMTARGLLVIHTPPSRLDGDGDALMGEVADAAASQVGRPPARVLVARR